MPTKETASQRNSDETLRAQLETGGLKGVHTNSMIENLIEIVLKLSEEVGLLRKESESMKIKTEHIHMAARARDGFVCQDLLPQRGVTSLEGPTVNVLKTLKNALWSELVRGLIADSAFVSAATTPPNTAMN